ncbi:MAG: SpoIIE family protein phosphatase [Gammaproteobacteria bacterium]|nr:SpoIIE family protein phosphatase [Gammaproteobacteria bacterium]
MSATNNKAAFLGFLGDSEFAEGQLVANGFEIHGFSARSPHKQTDNEDSALAMSYGENGVILAVADGAGGLPAGRKASNTLIETFIEMLPDAAQAAMPMRVAIISAIEESNRRIQEFSNGSATTLTVAGIEGDELRHYQIGDSVAYLVGQRGKLKTQTMQHSPVGFAVEAGLMDEKEAMTHEDRHYVSNFVGIAGMRIEVGSAIRISARDTILVASDGLADNLHIGEIIDIARAGPLGQCAEELGEASLARMTMPAANSPSKADDLTVLIARRCRT